MVQVRNIDVSQLQAMLNGVRDALVGVGGDVSTITADETSLLAREIAGRVGPLDRSKTRDRIAKSVRSKFLELGSSENSVFERKGGHSNSNIVWYRCDKNFLFGASRDLDMRRASGEELANIYYASKKVQGRTRIVADFVPARPHQKVAITVKVITTKRAVNSAVSIVQQAIGKLRASWLATSKKIDPAIVGPQWIERHINNGKTTKSITDLTGLQSSENPSTLFGSRARGVGRFSRLVSYAVEVRTKKLKARLKLVLSGYSKDVAQGIKAKRRGKSGGHP